MSVSHTSSVCNITIVGEYQSCPLREMDVIARFKRWMSAIINQHIGMKRLNSLMEKRTSFQMYVEHPPVGERLLGLRWRRRFAAKWWLPLDPVEHRLAAGAQRAAGARRQHGSVDLHFLVEGADFYGRHGGALGVQVQRERHVTEDVLGSQVNAFARVCYQLYVGNGGVACDIRVHRLSPQTVFSL